MKHLQAFPQDIFKLLPFSAFNAFIELNFVLFSKYGKTYQTLT